MGWDDENKGFEMNATNYTVTAWKTTYRRKPLAPEDWKREHQMTCETRNAAREQVKAFQRMGYDLSAITVESSNFEIDIFSLLYGSI